jgi:gliding motility-associated-like protein
MLQVQILSATTGRLLIGSPVLIAFTPNADGENDFFYPHGKGVTQVTRFRIYDRWGELLYERTNMPINDRSYGWNGTYKNQILKPDVYVYIIDATCTNGEPLQIKGDISLVR